MLKCNCSCSCSGSGSCSALRCSVVVVVVVIVVVVVVVVVEVVVVVVVVAAGKPADFTYSRVTLRNHTLRPRNFTGLFLTNVTCLGGLDDPIPLLVDDYSMGGLSCTPSQVLRIIITHDGNPYYL